MTFTNGDFSVHLLIGFNKYKVWTVDKDVTIQSCEYDSLLHAHEKFTQYVNRHLAKVKQFILEQ